MAAEPLERDTFETSEGELGIVFVGHGTLIFEFGGKVIHVDPFSRLTDYAKMPDADLVLLTHEHYDHLDPEALREVRTKDTIVVLTKTCAQSVDGGVVMANGDVKTAMGIRIEAVPAYNRVHTRGNGEPFHSKGVGNGYVLTFGDKHVYVAGDTENVPEMKDLKDIEIAFLPMNLPYTMTPEMASDAARMVRPKVLYPYHYGDTDPARLVELLKDAPEIKVRLRHME